MKYKVGDKVRIVKKWTAGCNQNFDGLMDKWLGKVMTIMKIYCNTYKMKEDRTEWHGEGWCWNEGCIEGLAEDGKKIVITTDGKETLARMYDGNKVVKTATAKCSPADTFDFKTGAELAFNRLFEKAEEKKDQKKDGHKFKVGDRVRRINCDGMFFGIGETGVVVETDNSRVPYHIKKDNGLYVWNEESTLELAPEKPKYYNGKVVCVDSPYHWFKIGKIYNVVDGVLTADDGDKYPRVGNPYVDEEDVKHAGNDGTGDERHNSKNTFIPLVE